MKMKNIFSAMILLCSLALVSCESADEISKSLDHEVPSCTELTLSIGGQTKVIDNMVSWKLLWGVVPQANLQTIELPTVTAQRGSIIDISVVLSDNVAVKTVELAYADWLFSKYINFSNPEENIPLTPKNYTFSAQVPVPSDAVTQPWIETFYFNDGSTMKFIQSYHKLSLTVVDINMNERTIPIFVMVE